MVCGKCGKEYAEGAKFCTNCGADLTDEEAVLKQAAEAVEEKVEEAVEAEAETVEDTVEEADAVTDVAVAEEAETLVGEVVTGEEADGKKKSKKVKNLSEKKMSWKGKLLLGVAALFLVILIPVLIFSGKDEYTTRSGQSVVDFYEEHERVFAYLQNGDKLFLDDTEVSVEGESLDRTTICYSNENGELVILKDGKTIRTGIEDAKGVKVSSDGDTFVYFSDCENLSFLNMMFGSSYTNEVGTLHLYFIKKGRDIKIAEEVLVNSAVLSPDGETVAYVADYEASDDFYGYYSVKGKKPEKVGKEKRVFAISDKGKYIYYTDDDRIYAQKKDESEKLAKDLYSTSVMVNADCTELIFIDEDSTYISVKGGEKIKVSKDELNALVMKNDTAVGTDFIRSDVGTIMVTYAGVDTFKNKMLYCTDSRDIMYVKDNYEAECLASATSLYGVADHNKSLVYVDGPDLVKVTDFVNGGVKTDLKEDANIRELYATGDLKYIYYLNSDNELYCYKGSKARKIADDVTSAVISSDGKYCYYVVDDEKLCYSKKGKKGKELLENEEAEIICEGSFGITFVKIKEEGTTTVYRMDEKKTVPVYSFKEKSIEELLKEKYNLDDPLDSILN